LGSRREFAAGVITLIGLGAVVRDFPFAQLGPHSNFIAGFG